MLSVVVPARDAERVLAVCLDSLLSQDPPPGEVIVVDDGSVDRTAELARARGTRVISLPKSRGPGGARNAGVEAATGVAVCFVDSDDRVQPGWVAAITEAFHHGAVVAASAGTALEDGSLAAAYPILLLHGRAPVRSADNPFVSGFLLSIRRDVFLSVGGFDEQLRMGEDLDLSFRLAMAGHNVTPVEDAVVEYHGRDSVKTLMRQRAAWEYWNTFLQWKYQHHPLLMARYRYARARVMVELAVAVAEGLAGHRRQARFSLLHASVLTARRIGELKGLLDLLLLRRRPPDVVPPSDKSHRVVAFPPSPSALIIGDRRLVSVVARGVHADSAFAAPPPGLAIADRWDDPAPWPRRLVREARDLGWRVPLEISSRRIEWEQPTSYGAALLVLHGIAAWLGSKRSFALSASGSDGALLTARFSGVPIVVVGGSSDGDLQITRRQLRHDPAGVAERLSAVLGLDSTRRVGIALRLAGLKALL